MDDILLLTTVQKVRRAHGMTLYIIAHLVAETALSVKKKNTT
jgi:hypothetical protein